MPKLLNLLFLFPLCCFAQIPEYYNSIDFTKTPIEIKEQLSNLIIQTHTDQIPYTSTSTDTWDILKESDLVVVNSAEVQLLYGYNNADSNIRNHRTRSKNLSCHTNSCKGYWTREHIFPKSLAAPKLATSYAGAGTDVHNLKPADSDMNAYRSNRMYNGGSGNATVTNKGDFYPGEEWVGDVARIIMYMYLRYPTQCLPTTVAGGSTIYAPDAHMPDILLTWNEQDPVSQEEIYRNNKIAEYQGNRNPFIDNPYLATLIWNGPKVIDTWGIFTIDDFSQIEIAIYPIIKSVNICVKNQPNKIAPKRFVVPMVKR